MAQYILIIVLSHGTKVWYSLPFGCQDTFCQRSSCPTERATDSKRVNFVSLVVSHMQLLNIFNLSISATLIRAEFDVYRCSTSCYVAHPGQ